MTVRRQPHDIFQVCFRQTAKAVSRNDALAIRPSLARRAAPGFVATALAGQSPAAPALAFLHSSRHAQSVETTDAVMRVQHHAGGADERAFRTRRP